MAEFSFNRVDDSGTSSNPNESLLQDNSRRFFSFESEAHTPPAHVPANKVAFTNDPSISISTTTPQIELTSQSSLTDPALTNSQGYVELHTTLTYNTQEPVEQYINPAVLTRGNDCSEPAPNNVTNRFGPGSQFNDLFGDVDTMPSTTLSPGGTGYILQNTNHQSHDLFGPDIGQAQNSSSQLHGSLHYHSALDTQNLMSQTSQHEQAIYSLDLAEATSMNQTISWESSYYSPSKQMQSLDVNYNALSQQSPRSYEPSSEHKQTLVCSGPLHVASTTPCPGPSASLSSDKAQARLINDAQNSPMKSSRTPPRNLTTTAGLMPPAATAPITTAPTTTASATTAPVTTTPATSALGSRALNLSLSLPTGAITPRTTRRSRVAGVVSARNGQQQLTGGPPPLSSTPNIVLPNITNRAPSDLPVVPLADGSYQPVYCPGCGCNAYVITRKVGSDFVQFYSGPKSLRDHAYSVHRIKPTDRNGIELGKGHADRQSHAWLVAAQPNPALTRAQLASLEPVCANSRRHPDIMAEIDEARRHAANRLTLAAEIGDDEDEIEEDIEDEAEEEDVDVDEDEGRRPFKKARK
ncbi:hypothetical protein BT63DRAFT_419179 [Microthyrium microscopicum]|uniref:Uncharacterized protein n=1 Tax=Microthyrium microscopicum TaxID=703497 RepID=A0A6A6TVL7_9PEZI|nr:hypothetical protein BT63DRAFT_419179 [Microthyrium microscopicum]